MVSLALNQPDIPQNTGAMLRLCACPGVEVHVIQPAGFDLSDRAPKRAGMDYLGHVRLQRHRSWDEFEAGRRETRQRLVLLTTPGDVAYASFGFGSNDVLMVGRETSGVPDEIHRAAAGRLTIPMVDGLRSINVATAAAMVPGEVLRQTGGFPGALKTATQGPP